MGRELRLEAPGRSSIESVVVETLRGMLAALDTR